MQQLPSLDLCNQSPHSYPGYALDLDFLNLLTGHAKLCPQNQHHRNQLQILGEFIPRFRNFTRKVGNVRSATYEANNIWAFDPQPGVWLHIPVSVILSL